MAKTKHGLYAYLDWVNQEAIIVDYKNHEGKVMFKKTLWDLVVDYETDEEALEELLKEALKLTPKEQ